MKNIRYAVLMSVVVLAACGEKAPEGSAATVAKDMGMPQECADYFAKVEACVSKAGASADMFKQAMEQMKTQATAADMSSEQKAAMATSCKQATEQFPQAAAAMNC